jgi:hypothetical protein
MLYIILMILSSNHPFLLQGEQLANLKECKEKRLSKGFWKKKEKSNKKCSFVFLGLLKIFRIKEPLLLGFWGFSKNR